MSSWDRCWANFKRLHHHVTCDRDIDCDTKAKTFQVDMHGCTITKRVSRLARAIRGGVWLNGSIYLSFWGGSLVTFLFCSFCTVKHRKKHVVWWHCSRTQQSNVGAQKNKVLNTFSCNMHTLLIACFEHRLSRVSVFIKNEQCLPVEPFKVALWISLGPFEQSKTNQGFSRNCFYLPQSILKHGTYVRGAGWEPTCLNQCALQTYCSWTVVRGARSWFNTFSASKHWSDYGQNNCIYLRKRVRCLIDRLELSVPRNTKGAPKFEPNDFLSFLLPKSTYAERSKKPNLSGY